MRTHLVAEAHGVDVVGMSRDAEDTSPCFKIVDVHAVIAGSGHDLATVTAEAQTPDAKVASAPRPAHSTVEAVPAAAHVAEVEQLRIRAVHWIGGCQADLTPDGAVRQELVVRAQTGVGDGP